MCSEVYDLGIVNTFFEKKNEHITYKNKGNKLQIDYFLVRIELLKEFKDCKVIPEEGVITQHKIMVLKMK